MGKARLLIVEDDFDISNMLQIYFTGLDYAVDIAPRGSDALEKTRQKMPHLIVLDIMLPDIDGYEVCRILRTNTRTSHIPVIFLTQKDERSDKLQGLELGADDYITKPFDIEELKLRVQNAIARAVRESLTDPRTGLPSGRLIEEQLRQMELELQQAAEKEEAERKRQEELARQKRNETPVVIEGNRVFVPVTIGNNGIEIEVRLLLDTGASQTVVYRDVANQLNIVALQKGRTQVASGQQVYTEVGKVSYLKVGPKIMENFHILIINFEGSAVSYSGLLGMNFLKRFQYNIDFENQVIRWKSPTDN
ncbi:MAG: response regulator [Anaerolineales bacterium]